MTSLLFILLLLTDLLLTGTSRNSGRVRWLAVQGGLLSILPLLVHAHGQVFRALWLTALIACSKGYLLPRLLRRAHEATSDRPASAAYFGSSTSVVAGVVAVGVSIWLGRIVTLPEIDFPLLIPAALSTMLVGGWLMLINRHELAQVVGYLVLGNGIFACGIVFAQQEPVQLELTVMVDAVVAVCLIRFSQSRAAMTHQTS